MLNPSGMAKELRELGDSIVNARRRLGAAKFSRIEVRLMNGLNVTDADMAYFVEHAFPSVEELILALAKKWDERTWYARRVENSAPTTVTGVTGAIVTGDPAALSETDLFERLRHLANTYPEAADGLDSDGHAHPSDQKDWAIANVVLPVLETHMAELRLTYARRKAVKRLPDEPSDGHDRT